MLAHPRVSINDIVPAIPALGEIDPQLLARVQIDGVWFPYDLIGFAIVSRPMTKFLGRYSPFLRRQEADLKAFHEDEDLILDPHMDYSGVSGISSEVKEKLAAIKPTTIVGDSTQIYARGIHVHYRVLLSAWKG